MVEKRIITYMAILCHIIFSIECSPISYKEKTCNKGTLYQCNCKSCWKEFEIRNETEKFLNWVQIELINCPNEQEIKTFDDLQIRKRIANWVNEECALVLDCNKIGITKRINEKDVIIGGSIECTPLGGQIKINVIGKGNHLTKENVVPPDTLIQILQAREHLLSYIIGIDLMSISTLSSNKVYPHQFGDLNGFHFDMFEDNNKNESEDDNYEDEDGYDDDGDEEEDYGQDGIHHHTQKINLDDDQTNNNNTLDNQTDLFMPSIDTTTSNNPIESTTKSYITSPSTQFTEEKEIVTTSTLLPSITTKAFIVSTTTSTIKTKLPNITLQPQLSPKIDEIPDDIINNNYDSKVYSNDKPSTTFTFNNISIEIPEWLTISLIVILTTLLLVLCVISCITYMFINCHSSVRKISKDKANKGLIIKKHEERNDVTRLEENSNVEKMLLEKVGTGII
uniref:Recep_L_domain domain-containing protein n=1 Tax=Strongyloides papillosus TaxID=174720 RepID=A0A0N5BK31_STREA